MKYVCPDVVLKSGTIVGPMKIVPRAKFAVRGHVRYLASWTSIVHMVVIVPKTDIA